MPAPSLVSDISPPKSFVALNLRHRVWCTLQLSRMRLASGGTDQPLCYAEDQCICSKRINRNKVFHIYSKPPQPWCYLWGQNWWTIWYLHGTKICPITTVYLWSRYSAFVTCIQHVSTFNFNDFFKKKNNILHLTPDMLHRSLTNGVT